MMKCLLRNLKTYSIICTRRRDNCLQNFPLLRVSVSLSRTVTGSGFFYLGLQMSTAEHDITMDVAFMAADKFAEATKALGKSPEEFARDIAEVYVKTLKFINNPPVPPVVEVPEEKPTEQQTE